ncbi:MAG: 3-hydroxyacyl-CoA dehydrogenase NAD-binding domain-containing protein [Pseudomonadota bacterium]|nr:3-hydroxyacyl-CoA dehydrogenase NAD-binding domain-containing protein [Pseudomonadota bacterium]
MSQAVNTHITRGVDWIEADAPADQWTLAGLERLVEAIDSADRGGAAKIALHAPGLFRLGLEWAVDPDFRAGVGTVVAAIERARAPVIALLAEGARDVGLEIAVACSARLAAEGTTLQSNVLRHGLVPAFGTCGRIRDGWGEGAALLLLSGRPFPAADAQHLALVQACYRPGDDEPNGLSLVQEVSGANAARPALDPEATDAWRRRIGRSGRGRLAHQVLLKLLSEASPVSRKAENAAFIQCLNDPQHRALLHVATAEAKAAQVPGVDPALAEPVHRAAVVGSGTMGGGIAMCFADAGIEVTVLDLDEAALERGRQVIERNYAVAVQRGSLSAQERDARLARIRTTTEYRDLAQADVVVEAVFEDLGLKQAVFARLTDVMRPDALLATNTSGLDIDRIGEVTRAPERVIGMHFFSPANVMTLLEVVRGANTSPAAIATAMGLAKRMEKVGVLAGNCPGFIGNRLLRGYIQQANELVLDGALVAQVDAVLRDFGLPMGPFQMMDLTGLDVGWRARKANGREPAPSERVHDRLCEQERFGQKSGAGFYRYGEDRRVPVPDPSVDALIAEVALEAGRTRRDIPDEEVLERCLFPLINEGARVLEEGMALRASDIDVTYVHGYGFPAHRGGPMYHAEQLGLAHIVARLEELAAEGGAFWAPAPLLQQRAAAEGTFSAD